MDKRKIVDLINKNGFPAKGRDIEIADEGKVIHIISQREESDGSLVIYHFEKKLSVTHTYPIIDDSNKIERLRDKLKILFAVPMAFFKADKIIAVNLKGNLSIINYDVAKTIALLFIGIKGGFAGILKIIAFIVALFLLLLVLLNNIKNCSPNDDINATIENPPKTGIAIPDTTIKYRGEENKTPEKEKINKPPNMPLQENNKATNENPVIETPFFKNASPILKGNFVGLGLAGDNVIAAGNNYFFLSADDYSSMINKVIQPSPSSSGFNSSNYWRFTKDNSNNIFAYKPYGNIIFISNNDGYNWTVFREFNKQIVKFFPLAKGLRHEFLISFKSENQNGGLAFYDNKSNGKFEFINKLNFTQFIFFNDKIYAIFNEYGNNPSDGVYDGAYIFNCKVDQCVQENVTMDWQEPQYKKISPSVHDIQVFDNKIIYFYGTNHYVYYRNIEEEKWKSSNIFKNYLNFALGHFNVNPDRNYLLVSFIHSPWDFRLYLFRTLDDKGIYIAKFNYLINDTLFHNEFLYVASTNGLYRFNLSELKLK